MNDTLENIKKDITTHYKVFNTSYCNITDSLTLQVNRKYAREIEQRLLHEYKNIYVFVETEIFKYAHVVISMKKSDNPNIDKWPYPDLDYRWNSGDYSWREVSERIFYDQLECVPPARMKLNTFAVGECWKHDENGIAIHAIGCEVESRYFMRHASLKDFNPVIYTQEIKAQFGL